MIYVYHHLGLGDHILCNGLVREVVKRYDTVQLFCKYKNYTSVADMYSDEKRITVIPIEGDENVKEFLKFNRCDALHIGATGKNWNEHSHKHFDELFYEQADLPFSAKYDSFHVTVKAKKIIEQEDFIFVHDDPERGYSIDYKLLERIAPTGIKMIVPYRKSNSIFDYIQVIEQAREVHCIDSAFLCLIDLLNIKGRKFFHWYARKANHFITPKIKDDWTELR